jgi:imidazolonepropionase-like amidohydrolase
MPKHTVPRVLKSGVKFAAGSDVCWFYPGKTRGQASAATLVNLRTAGMPPLDVIRAITVNAAEMLGGRTALDRSSLGNLLILLPSLETRSPILASSSEFDS